MSISLDLPPDPSPERWRATVHRIQEWNECTRPLTLHRLTDPDAPEEEPWTDGHEAEAIARLASGTMFTWQLFGTDDCVLTLRPRAAYVEVGLLVPRPGDPSGSFRRLIEAASGVLAPLLAMGWAARTDDDEFLLQGLHRLAEIPPLLFLASSLMDRFGVRAAIEAIAPTSEVVGGFIVASADPWNRKDPTGKKRRRAVAKALGMTAEKPLQLV